MIGMVKINFLEGRKYSNNNNSKVVRVNLMKSAKINELFLELLPCHHPASLTCAPCLLLLPVDCSGNASAGAMAAMPRPRWHPGESKTTNHLFGIAAGKLYTLLQSLSLATSCCCHHHHHRHRFCRCCRHRHRRRHFCHRRCFRSCCHHHPCS